MNKHSHKKGSVRRFLTDRARATFLPDAPPEGTRYVRPASQMKTTEVAGAFDESFDYENPASERYLPEEMDGVIQLTTPEQKATDRAYQMALEDPLSVIGPRLTEADYGYSDLGSDDIDFDDVNPRKGKTMRDAGHELAKKNVTDHHDPTRIKRIREGLKIEPDDE